MLAFSWGVSQAELVVGGGGASGKAIFDDLLVVARPARPHRSSGTRATGTHIKTAVLICRRSKAALEFLTITLSEVVVSSYEVDSSDDGPPLDQIALAYGKIETQYTPVDAAGKALTAVKAGWDVAAGKKV